MTAYPLSPTTPADPALTLPAELPEPLDFLAFGDLVRVTPTFGRKPFYANVEALVGERVIVSHEAFGYVSDHNVDAVTLILKRAARAALATLDAEIEAAAGQLPADWTHIARLDAARAALQDAALAEAKAAASAR